MTFCTHGFRATNLDTWPCSFGSVTRTICIFPTRGFGWTMRGSRDSVFQSRMPSPLTHRLIHPVRRKKANKRTRQSTGSDAYVVGRYRDDHWDPDCPGPSMRFVPLAALMFLLGDVFDGHKQQDDPESVPLLPPHAGGGTIAQPWSEVS